MTNMRVVDKTTPAAQVSLPAARPVMFLAGPCPRGTREETMWQRQWHAEALRLLAVHGFEGDVCIPLPHEADQDFEAGVLWEAKCLERADVILFWVPRDLDKLPGFTTNVEFGEYMHTGKVVLAYPEGAPKMRYLEVKARWNSILVVHTLEDAVATSVALLQRRLAAAATVSQADSIGLYLGDTRR